MKKFAFTIKEILFVLVLLVIIGVVTFLIANKSAKRQKYHALFATNYNLINRMFTKSMSRNGAIAYWDWQLEPSALFKVYFLPYLKIAQKCENDGKNCFANGENAYKYLNKSAINENLNKGQSMYVLENGAAVKFNVLNPRCVTYLTPCASILIDTNASLPPNVMGRDLFEFIIYPRTNNIMPKGVYIDEFTDGHWVRENQNEVYKNCDEKCHIGKPCGNLCGARLLNESKMNY